MTTTSEDLEHRLRRGDWRDDPEGLAVWLRNAPDITSCIADALAGAARAQDWLLFELLLLAAHQIPSRAYTRILCEVLDVHSDQVNNEDIVDVLAASADPLAVDALERALWWQPDWDEFHGLGVKCVWALAQIGTTRAWATVRDVAATGPAEIRNAAVVELSRHTPVISPHGPTCRRT